MLQPKKTKYRKAFKGRILFEIDGVPDDVAREALRLGAAKLPVRTKVVTRLDAGIAHLEEAA